MSTSRSPAVSAVVSAGLESLPSLEQEWRRLFAASSGQPSLSFEWTSALARTQVQPGDASCVIQLRRDGDLVGVVPLIERAVRVFGQWHIVLRPLAELKNTHSDLLLERTSDVIGAFLGALRTLDRPWDSIRLSKLIDGYSLTPLLEAQASVLGYTPRRRFRKAAYWLSLPRTFDKYLAARSSKFRNYARRAEKKLRAAGRLEELEVTTPAAFEAGYDALLHVERASWKYSHGTSITAIPKQEALYREWGRQAAHVPGHLHLQLLMLNGEPVAHNLGCVYLGTYYYLKTSYAAQYRPLSPATFLRLSLIRQMIDRGIGAIDFCGTPYEWERQWTETYRWHHVLSIYADTWRGRLFSVLDPWTHYSSSGREVRHEDPRSEQPG